MLRERRLLQEADRWVREAGAEVARLNRLMERREQEGQRAAQGEAGGLWATVAQMERQLVTERNRVAGELAARDRRHGAEATEAAVDEIATTAVRERALVCLD